MPLLSRSPCNQLNPRRSTQPIQLACVRRLSNVHSEPGPNSSFFKRIYIPLSSPPYRSLGHSSLTLIPVFSLPSLLISPHIPTPSLHSSHSILKSFSHSKLIFIIHPMLITSFLP